MKIYESIAIDMFTGEVVEEKSFEYNGPVIKLKGGQIAAQRQAEQAYKLQKQQLALQEQQLKELADKEKSKKYDEQRQLDAVAKLKMGQKASILTDISNFGQASVSRPSLFK
jgi:hypothetical protein